MNKVFHSRTSRILINGNGRFNLDRQTEKKGKRAVSFVSRWPTDSFRSSRLKERLLLCYFVITWWQVSTTKRTVLKNKKAKRSLRSERRRRHWCSVWLLFSGRLSSVLRVCRLPCAISEHAANVFICLSLLFLSSPNFTVSLFCKVFLPSSFCRLLEKSEGSRQAGLISNAQQQQQQQWSHLTCPTELRRELQQQSVCLSILQFTSKCKKRERRGGKC